MPDVVFAFHDDEELGPEMLSRIAKHTARCECSIV